MNINDATSAAQELAEAIWAAEAALAKVHRLAYKGLATVNAMPAFADTPVVVTRPATATAGPQPLDGGQPKSQA